MRRTGILLAAAVAFGLVQGCGTTKDKVVVDKKAPVAESAGTLAPHELSSKGGSAAKPGTVTVDFAKMSAAKPATQPPAEKKAAPPKPAPPPAKKEVVKQETKPAAQPAPPPPPPAKKAEPVKKPEPVKKAAKPKPAPKPAPVARAEPQPKATAEATPMVTPRTHPYSSKGGSAAKTGEEAETSKAPAPAAKSSAAPAKPAATKMAAAKPGSFDGAVRQVNNEYKFIVIEFESETPLAAGSELKIWRDGKLVGTARLEEPLTHWPLGTATLTDGSPEQGDSVSR